jgi:hypothetical protein
MFCRETGLSIRVLIIVEIAGTRRGVGPLRKHDDIFSFNENSEPSDSKIGHESRGTRNQESLRWRSPAAS